MIKTQFNLRRVKRNGPEGNQELYITKKHSCACFLQMACRNYTPGFICYIHKLVLELEKEMPLTLTEVPESLRFAEA